MNRRGWMRAIGLAVAGLPFAGEVLGQAVERRFEAKPIRIHRLDDVPVKHLVCDPYCPDDMMVAADGVACASPRFCARLPPARHTVAIGGATYTAWRIA